MRIAVHPEACRNTVAIAQQDLAGSRVCLEILPDNGLGLAVVDGQHHQSAAAKGSLDAVHCRLVLTADGAPRCPKLQQNNVSPERTVANRLAIQCPGSELRCWYFAVGGEKTGKQD